MPDPIIPNLIRVQAVFGHTSGLPEDRMVNNFAFIYESASFTFDEACDELAANALDPFYVTTGTATQALRTYMARELASLEYRFYDLSEAPPRFPYIVPSATWTQPPLVTSLPSEVALCLSWVAGFNLPRRRGRIYLGPLNDATLAQSGNPDPQFVADLAAKGDDLLAYSTFPSLFQVMISQADQAANQITGGWVDNAFDTQRRRGVTASSRTTFGTYQGQ